MTTWKTDAALMQAETDMLHENDADRNLIWTIERRIAGRTRLIKMLRRRFRHQGLVNTSGGDSLNPRWMRKDSIE